MLATTSVSAIYLWFLGTATLRLSLLLMKSQGRTTPIRKTLALWLVSIVVLLIAWIYYIGATESPTTNPILSQLFWDQVVARGLIEDFDVAIWDFLFDNPTALLVGVGLGNAHLYADQYLEPEFAAYAQGTAFVAKSGYLRVLSELGLVGLCLFLGWVVAELTQLRSRLQRSDLPLKLRTQGIALVGFGWAMLLCFMMRGDYLSQQFYLTIGVVVAMIVALRTVSMAGVNDGPPK
jgi:O-antigen ligase